MANPYLKYRMAVYSETGCCLEKGYQSSRGVGGAVALDWDGIRASELLPTKKGQEVCSPRVLWTQKTKQKASVFHRSTCATIPYTLGFLMFFSRSCQACLPLHMLECFPCFLCNGFLLLRICFCLNPPYRVRCTPTHFPGFHSISYLPVPLVFASCLFLWPSIPLWEGAVL